MRYRDLPEEKAHPKQATATPRALWVRDFLVRYHAESGTWPGYKAIMAAAGVTHHNTIAQHVKLLRRLGVAPAGYTTDRNRFRRKPPRPERPPAESVLRRRQLDDATLAALAGCGDGWHGVSVVVRRLGLPGDVRTWRAAQRSLDRLAAAGRIGRVRERAGVKGCGAGTVKRYATLPA